MRIVKSGDGRFEGEKVGTAAAGSWFSKLAIDMETEELTQLIGGPNNMTGNDTGER